MLGVGFIAGWKAEGVAITHPENISEFVEGETNGSAQHQRLAFDELLQTKIFQFSVLVGTVALILLFWTLILLAKSHRNESVVKKTNRALENEIEKRENATNELQSTNQKLSTTSGQLAGIIKGTTDQIAAVDRDLRFISFNDSYKQNNKELFGTEIKVGMHLGDALSGFPKAFEDSKRLWRKALAGEQFSGEQMFANGPANPIHYELSYTPIRDSAGEVIGASQICRDVTERKLTAEKLKEERDFASAIFDLNSSLIIVVNREGRIFRFNRACEKLSGYNEEEIKNRVFWNMLIPTEEINDVKQTYQNLDSDEFGGEIVHRWITKDEEYRLISWHLSVIKDEHEANEYVVATGIDVTEKHEFETAQTRMLEILENSSDFIRISDLQGQIAYLNPAGRKMLGLNDETEVAHLRIHSCHPKWANDLMQTEGYPKAVKSGTWLGETAVKTLGNEEIPTSQLILAHRGKSGNLENFSTVIRDISQQKSLEDDLEKARDSALETTRIKSEFLANMSHEIRTPMNGIIGIAELLANTSLDETQQDYAETIQQCGDTLLTIINDILDFSKLEAGKVKFEKVDFDLTKTIESIIDIFAHDVTQKNLNLCMLIHPNVPSRLIGDPGRLRQVLTNLISNAVKFTETGEIVVRVKLEDQTESGTPTLRFTVSDTGIGISPDVEESLFAAFSQADTTITRRFGGTGLGLAISKQLVGMMSGEIGVESNESRGSTFWFTADFEKQETAETITFEKQELRKIRLLIIEENQTLRNILVFQAKSLGMAADESPSAEKALELMKTAAQNGEAFHGILLDDNLKDDSGLSFASKIKETPKLRNTKIIAISSFENRTNSEYQERGKFDRFVYKPIKQTELLQTLETTFSPKKKSSAENLKLDSISKPTNNNPKKQTKGASTMYPQFEKDVRILIAEDNLVNQKVILNQVTGLGYKVELVENGKEVLDALKLKNYSLILMDCQMPIMDGFEATTKIRESETGTSNRIPIIAVTAHAIEDDRQRCLDCGMDDYISKPTKQKVLAESIEFWLKNEVTVDSRVGSNPETAPEQIETENSESDSVSERLTELEENCGSEIVLECIELFISDTTELTREISKAVADGNFEKLVIDAHKLKGSASNMGAEHLPMLCSQIIQFARDEELEAAQKVDIQIRNEYELLKTIYAEKLKLYKSESEMLHLTI